MRKLGWGQFATVWLAFDTKENIFTAIKIHKSQEDYTVAAKAECKILREMRKSSDYHRGSKNVVQMLNFFDFHGVDECLHFCVVFEVLGDNLLTLLRRFNSLNLNFVKVVAKQMLAGLSFIHDQCNIIHTDIKPENVVISLTEKQIYQLAIHAYNYHGIDKQPPRSLISTSSDEYRNKCYLTLSSSDRERIRRCCKKHREKAERFLKVIDAENVPPRIQDDDKHEPHIGCGDQACSSNDDDDVGGDDIVVDDGCFANNPISHYYEELQAGNIACLKQCTVKIVDFGNACFVEQHFSEEIQTREYRSPEVIIGCEYDTSADIWSAACVIFELVTGDYLFYPENHKDGYYDDVDDHIAKIQEILGPLPTKRFRDGRHYNHLFDSRGNLRRIPKLAPAPLKKIISDLTEFTEEDAEEMTNFLKSMLHYDTRHRASAAGSLRSKWLTLSEVCEMKRKRRDNLEVFDAKKIQISLFNDGSKPRTSFPLMFEQPLLNETPQMNDEDGEIKSASNNDDALEFFSFLQSQINDPRIESDQLRAQLRTNDDRIIEIEKRLKINRKEIPTDAKFEIARLTLSKIGTFQFIGGSEPVDVAYFLRQVDPEEQPFASRLPRKLFTDCINMILGDSIIYYSYKKNPKDGCCQLDPNLFNCILGLICDGYGLNKDPQKDNDKDKYLRECITEELNITARKVFKNTVDLSTKANCSNHVATSIDPPSSTPQSRSQSSDTVFMKPEAELPDYYVRSYEDSDY